MTVPNRFRHTRLCDASVSARPQVAVFLHALRGYNFSNPRENDETEVNELKAKNPDFQAIYDRAVKTGKDAVAKQLEAMKQEASKRDEALRAELKKLQEGKTLSEQEKADLAKKVASWEEKYMTAEQRLQKEIESMARKHEEDKLTLVNNTKAWQTRHADLFLTTEILKLATNPKKEAHNAAQIVALLKSDAEVYEKLQDGKGTGSFGVKLRFRRDGKEEQLELPDAWKIWSDLPENSNLFKATGSGGAADGSQRLRRDGTMAAPENLSEYKAGRKQFLESPLQS